MSRATGQGGIDYQDGGFPSGGSVYPMTRDLAELAARINKPVGIDRSGNIVFAEDFRFGDGSIETLSKGLGETMGLSPLYSRYGGFTYKLARVDDDTSWCNFQTYASIIKSDRIGLEIQFCGMVADPNLQIYIGRYTGEVHYVWGLRWDAQTNKIYIGGDTVGWTEIAEKYDIFLNVPHYHNMKLVVDVVNKDYERVIIDGKVIPVVAKAARESENPNSPHVVATVSNASGYAGAAEVYTDYIILTRNEPPGR